MFFYAKGEGIKGTGRYNSNNYWVEDVLGTTSALQHGVTVGLTAAFLLRTVFYESITKKLAKELNISVEDCISCVVFFCSVHDAGKLHPLFQKNFVNAVEEMKKYNLIAPKHLRDENQRIRHEVISRGIIQDYLKEKVKLSNLVTGILYNISSHHEKNKEYMDGRFENILVAESFWEDSQNDYVKRLHSIFPFDLNILDTCDISKTDRVCLKFFMVLVFSDWLASSYLSDKCEFFNECASNNDFQPYIDYAQKHLEYIMREELGLLNEKKIDLSSYSKILNVENPVLRPLQEKLKSVLKENSFKFLLLEDTMGSGKTEAGLYAAGHMGIDKDGVLIALPTGVTADTMYDRIVPLVKAMGVSSLNLIHSTAFVHDKLYAENIVDSKGFLSSSRTGLFVNSCVTTVDQVMLGAMKVKFSPLRLLGLINKVLIIDEVHAYDAYMSGILHVLLNWCNLLDIPVILLSATLPKNIRQSLISSYMGTPVTLKEESYPLITGVTMSNEVKEIAVDTSFIEKNITFKPIKLNDGFDNLLSNLSDKLANKHNVGFICNTVPESRAIFSEVRKKFPDHECVLLHSRLTLEERKKRENYIKDKLGKSERAEGLIVVGTQVLEQSLDIDFDTMYCMICPIDLLLQRLGRWRRFILEGRKEDDSFYIVYNYNEVGYKQYECIYPKYLLKRTELYVTDNPKCSLPNDFRKCLEFVYGVADLTDKDYIDMYSENEAKKYLGGMTTICKDMGDVSQRSQLYTSNPTSSDDFEPFTTRLGRPQMKVIFMLPEEKSLYNPDELLKVKRKDLALELMYKSFSVPYDDLPIEPDDSSNFLDCGGLLKGYRVYFVKILKDGTKGFIREDDKSAAKRYIRQLSYSKELGYMFKKDLLG